MNVEALRLIAAAVTGVAVSVALIVRGRLHPFMGLLTGALLLGLLAGLGVADTVAAIEKGVGAILGGTGLVVALGLALGAMLHQSGGAAVIARAMLGVADAARAPWLSLALGMLIGLPLFFETGLVLLLPVIAAVAQTLCREQGGQADALRLRLMLSALAGLSVVHALVPPHPGPLIAVHALGANLGRTMVNGLIVAIPTAVIAGPLLARWTARGVPLTPVVLNTETPSCAPPSAAAALTILLLPVLLIAGGQVRILTGGGGLAWLGWASDPLIALLLTTFVALPLLFGRAMADAGQQERLWSEAVQPAGAVLLAIGAGGALKQVLVTAGLPALLERGATAGMLPQLVLGWAMAAGVRVATGSATVATITTAGLMAGVPGASPEWLVLAIGAGSVACSHVNDPGFWLVKSYLGTDTTGTFRTWTSLETAISVVGLLAILVASRLW